MSAEANVRDGTEVREELAHASGPVDASGDGGVAVRRLRAPKEADAPHGGAANPFVEVHYEGFLADGDDKFDSSRESGYPFVVELGKGKVIPGWEVALQVLRVGEFAEVTVKPEYAYGDEESEDIPANSTLRFEIEVLDARKTAKAVKVTPAGNDADAERLAEIRRQREEAAKMREELRQEEEKRKKANAEKVAARLANKGQKKGGKGKKK